MTRIVTLDLEGNGLYNTITQLWCGVTKDLTTGEVKQFKPVKDAESDLYILDPTKLLSYLDTCDVIIAHNGIDFDIPVLEKLYGWTFEGTVIDTLVMSRHLNPDRPAVDGVRGPHGVEAWGKRLGRWKPENEDWTRYTDHMLHRCTEDVEIQELIYLTLCSEANVIDPKKSIFDKDNYHKGGTNWHLSLWLEHESARIFKEQSVNGCYFETEKAIEYVNTLSEIIDREDADISKNIAPKPKKKGVTIEEPFTKTGAYKKMVTDWYNHLNYEYEPYLEDDLLWKFPDVCGPFSRVDWEYINLGSDKQLKEWLFSIGWKPDEWNYKKGEYNPDGSRIRTSPKITESSLEAIDSDLGRKITLRSKASHRRSQIQGWIDNVRIDHRIEGQANPQGTNTGRVRHRIVANIPKVNIFEDKNDKSNPKNGSIIWYPEKQKVFFGSEMRSLFSAGPDPDWCLIGRDASGLELRCFAHYINDPAYTDIILNGDIHTYNQEAAGLETRDQAKTFIYAFLYGAGDAKIGSIVAPHAPKDEQTRIGKQLKEQFLKSNPRLEALIKNVKKASRRGYLIGIDGRKLIMRQNEGRVAENKALNTLLQGAGAQIMTYARVWLNNKVKENGWEKEALKVLDYHDEETYQTLVSRSQDMKELMIQSVVEAGKFFNFNCPLDADAKIGQSWAEVH